MVGKRCPKDKENSNKELTLTGLDEDELGLSTNNLIWTGKKY